MKPGGTDSTSATSARVLALPVVDIVLDENDVPLIVALDLRGADLCFLVPRANRSVPVLVRAVGRRVDEVLDDGRRATRVRAPRQASWEDGRRAQLSVMPGHPRRAPTAAPGSRATRAATA